MGYMDTPNMAASGLLLGHFCELLLSSAEEDRFGGGLFER